MTNLFIYFVATIAMFTLSLDVHADNSNSSIDTSTKIVAPKSDQNQSTLQLDDLTKKKNSVQGASEIDDLLTNNNLRALSGSTSRWSIASIFNYNGGTIASPFEEDRPDITNSSGTTTKADLDGTINVKYNLGVKDSLMLGFGVRWIAPLSPSGPSNYNGTTFDAINPQVTYQHIYKLGGIQSVFQLTGMQWTQADQTALGYDKNVNIDQESMYQVPGTKLSIGAGLLAQYQTFDKSGPYTTASGNYIADLATVQSQYMFGLVPEFEYQLTSKVNLRTTVGLWVYEHYLAQSDLSVYQQDEIYESVGVGYSVSRDIFLYPNVQFLPEHIRSDMTNVGLAATINLF